MVLVGSLLVIAWLALHWAILPHIEQWRPQIENRASAVLGVPVRIGGIEVRSSGWVPAVELRDVELLDAHQRPALRLPRVATALSPRSLLALEPRFEQVLIEGAQLEVRRDVQGHVFVAGLDLSGAVGDETDAADWVLRQHEIIIRGGTLRWTDERRSAPALELTDVELVLRNGLRRHDLRLDATPPPEWGDRFSLRGQFTQSLLARAGDWQHWSGQAYAELPRADLHRLRQYVALPFELSEGVGALRAWLEVRDGQPLSGTADVALRAVSLRLADNVAPLVLEHLEGRISGQRTELGLTLALQRFGFVAGNGVRWPSGDLNLSLRQRSGEVSSGGDFNAQHLDLGLMAEVAASLPLGDAVRRLLSEVKPQGVVSGLGVQWDGPLDAPSRYHVTGRLGGLSLASRAASRAGAVGRPGLRNASIVLDAREDGGSARLSLVGGAVDLPGVFENPVIPLDRLSAQLQWKVNAGKVAVHLREASFANRDVQGGFSGRWSTGAGKGVARGGRLPGQIELGGKLTQGVAARTARYLPLGLPESTRRYVERAVKSGTLSSVDFRVKGDLWDFPFQEADSKGELTIAAQAEDVTFAYVPDEPATPGAPASASSWPVLTRVKGELVLDKTALRIRNAQAQLGGVQWSRIQGDIADLSGDAVLKLEGSAAGPVSEMLKFVDVTPIGGWIDGALARSTATAGAALSLDLAIPLERPEDTEVKGSVVLGGNDVRVTPDSPLLTSAQGRIDFDRRGFSVVGAKARVHGGEIGFEGGTQGDGRVRFTGQGSTTAEALRGAGELGVLSRLARQLKGQAHYQMELDFASGHPEITLTSNLVGMASELPAPLGKPAETPLALRYQTRMQTAVQTPLQTRVATEPAPPLRDTLSISLGNLVRADYQRDLSGAEPRVLRGGVGVGALPPTPPSGVAVRVNVDSLNLDAWDVAYDKMFDAGTMADGDSADASYAPSVMNVRSQEVTILSRRLSKVDAGITLEKGQWRADLQADQLKGYVEYRAPQHRATPGPDTSGRVYARLSRLSMPRSEVAEVETLLDEQPTTAPTLDIVIDDFELRGKRLGRLEIEASNRVYTEGQEALREWRLSKFNLVTPEAQLTASGHWALGAPGATRRRAVMDFNLALADSGQYLERLGMGRAVRGGKGQITGQLAWQGSPLTIDYASLAGQAHVEVEAGQFLKVDPGAARLLGVLSLQALPRRLALDFRDVFEEGFAFDSFAGDLQINQGVAHTNNLRMRGVQAAVLMEGSADLARETQNLRVVVVPEINAGTASLAYAIINPAIGLGTFLAQLFLRQPFSEAGTREFRVTGPWDDPKVDRVERRAGAASATAGPPAAAASQPRPTQ